MVLLNSTLCLIASTADGLMTLAGDGSRHRVLWGPVLLWLGAKQNLNVIPNKHPDEE